MADAVPGLKIFCRHFCGAEPPTKAEAVGHRGLVSTNLDEEGGYNLAHKTFSSILPPAPVAMAVVLPAGGFRSEMRSTFHGDCAALTRKVSAVRVRSTNPPRAVPMMGNVNEGKGLFAPIVVIARNVIGKKRFNQLRGKAIALHSQVKMFF